MSQNFRTLLLLSSVALALTGCPGTDPPPTDGGGIDAPTPEVDAPTTTDAGSDGGTAGCVGPPGLYVAGSCTELAPGVRPFTPNYTLWSDSAAKERFIFLPEGTTIDTTDPDAWVFPVGTVFFKTFSRDGLRIETRINTKTTAGSGASHWTLRTFAWSADQMSVTEVFDEVVDALGTDHNIPSTSLCISCHSGAGVDVGLGFSAIQLNHADTELSLQDLIDENLLSADIAPTAALIPGGPGGTSDLVVTEALGYLHANCGNCHGGPSPAAGMRLWVDVGLTDPSMTGTYMTAVDMASGWPGAPYRVSSGEPENSAILLRMMSRTAGDQMPPIATEISDPTGIAAVTAWVDAL